MTKGEEIVKTWESRQCEGRYPSYVEPMADLAALIDSCILEPVKVVRDCVTREVPEYRSDSERFRAAGWTSDTSDYVDEFPRW